MKKFFEKFGCGMEKTIQQVKEDKERLEKIQDIIKTENNMKAEDWIKVEDRLPERKVTNGIIFNTSEWVLICYKRFDNEKVCIPAHFNFLGNYWEVKSSVHDNCFGYRIEKEKVTHWMPIILPKEEE